MEKDLDMGAHARRLETFLVEFYNGKRSAAVYVGTMLHRVECCIDRKQVHQQYLFESTRDAAEAYAKQWIMEK